MYNMEEKQPNSPFDKIKKAFLDNKEEEARIVTEAEVPKKDTSSQDGDAKKKESDKTQESTKKQGEVAKPLLEEKPKLSKKETTTENTEKVLPDKGTEAKEMPSPKKEPIVENKPILRKEKPAKPTWLGRAFGNVKKEKEEEEDASKKQFDTKKRETTEKKDILGEPDEKKVPVIRTFANDVRSIINNSNDGDLRELALKEMEKKEREAREMKKKKKEVVKKGLVIKDDIRALKQQADLGVRTSVQSLQTQRTPVEKSSSEEDIRKALERAATYVREGKEDEHDDEVDAGPPQPEITEGAPTVVQSHKNTGVVRQSKTKPVGPFEQPIPQYTPPSYKAATPSPAPPQPRRTKRPIAPPPQPSDTAISREQLGDFSGIQQPRPPVQPTTEPAPPPAQPPIQPPAPADDIPSITGTAPVTGTPPIDTVPPSDDEAAPAIPPQPITIDIPDNEGDFSEEQERIIEKERLQNVWKDYTQEQAKLREQGIRRQDLRQFGDQLESETLAGRQRIIAIIAVVVLFSAFGVVVATVLLQPDSSERVQVPQNFLNPAPDIATTDTQIIADLTLSADGWFEALAAFDKRNTFAKVVPFAEADDQKNQLPLIAFLSRFPGITIPFSILQSLGDYYFIGAYNTGNSENVVFMFTLNNYNNTLVNWFAWERELLNEFSLLFPDVLSRSEISEVNKTTQVIENKNVYTFSNQNSSTNISYYFFNRNILVLIVGDTDIIAEVNRRIRSSAQVGGQ